MALLDHNILRSSHPGEVAQYLRRSCTESSEEVITEQLLATVESGSLPPHIFGIWLSSSPYALGPALKQNFSVRLRVYGIKRLGKSLLSSKWKETWEGLGGTEGLIQLFCEFSVPDIQNACILIALSAKGKDLYEKREKFTELLRALLHQNLEIINPDQRSLSKYYRRLVRGCTSEFIIELDEQILKPEWGVRRVILAKYHPDTLRKIVLRAAFDGHPYGIQWLSSTIAQGPRGPLDKFGFTPADLFALELLRRLAKENSAIPNEFVLEEIVNPLLRRTQKKTMPWPTVQEILNLGVQYLKFHPEVSIQAVYRENGKIPHDLFSSVLWNYKRQQEKAEEIAVRCFQERKKSAISNSNQNQRSINARSAILYAAASGSLNVYKEALEWVDRRFAHDSLTIHEVYNSHPDEAKELLVGIPTSINAAEFTYSTISNRIEEANKILRSLFEKACAVLREPFFNPGTWWSIFLFFQYIVQKRIEQSSNLKKSLHISDEEVYEILWVDTLKLIMTIEEKGLEDGYEKLALNNVGGILAYGNSKPVEVGGEEVEVSTFRFLDALAKARDELWRKFRPTVYPVAATLPEPFPRGLPIQHIIAPFYLNVPHLDVHAPYLSSRAKSAVFLQPAALENIPNKSDMKPAIGYFIDEYKTALRMLIPKYLDVEKFALEKKQRFEQAWVHAISELGRGRMSTGEAIRYWEPHFGAVVGKKWITKILAGRAEDDFQEAEESTDNKYPIDAVINPRSQDNDSTTITAAGLMPSTGYSHLEKWLFNIMNGPEPKDFQINLEIKSRNLGTFTYVDLSTNMNVDYHTYTINSGFRTFTAVVPRKSVQRGKAPPQSAPVPEWNSSDGEILSSLLYFDAVNASESRILSTPFPSADDDRFVMPPPSQLKLPPLITGKKQKNQLPKKDTLDKTRIKTELKILESNIGKIPPKLLARLVSNTLDSLNAASPQDKTYLNLEFLAFRLLELLTQSDRPALASKLAIHTIIRHPDRSPWHRRLMSLGFFYKLPAPDAHLCLSEFANVVSNKLEEMAEDKGAKAANPENSEPSENMGPGPLPRIVKVTTVKQLADLLQNPEFISEAFSLSTLSMLSLRSPHIDVKKAVVGSLLSIFNPSSANYDQYLAALECSIPIAGNLNENSPISDADWNKAVEDLELPTINLDFSLESKPVLAQLLDFESRQLKTVAHKTEFMNRIIIPILEKLKAETSRYISIFLRRQGISENDQKELKVAPVPNNCAIWEQILQDPAAPSSLLEEYVAYLIFNIAPPAPIKNLNEIFSKKGPGTYPPREGVHIWMELYGIGDKAAHRQSPLSLLTLKEQSECSISSVMIREQFLKIISTVLRNDSTSYPNFKQIMDKLSPFKLNKYWLENYRPIIDATFVHVNTLHAKQLEDSSSDRNTKLLPDVFPLSLWLLKYPSDEEGAEKEGSSSDDRDTRCRIFAEDIVKVIDKISGSVYHRKFSLLKDAPRIITDTNKLLTALYLGNTTKTETIDTVEQLNIRYQLRVELAADLISKSSTKDASLKEKVANLVESWKVSSDEEIRRLGENLQGAFALVPSYKQSKTANRMLSAVVGNYMRE
ncbi:hypothetical protein ABW20_dc0105631 [Dactylellina cionopaga]|nr:hypothetical protein ABW20_dc0105631 [Dactylellina cionopaga]